MLTAETIKEFAKKFQTPEKNIVREYVQHLFLSNLYKIKNSVKLFFKGGTAFRIIYQSPRFSEDIDFTGQDIFHTSEIDGLFLETLSQIEKAGIHISYKDAKPTTGGYLGVIHYEIFRFFEDMKFEVSLRRQKKMRGELIGVISDFTSPYTLKQLPTRDLVVEKLHATSVRRKPRDYYDLYFILRHPELHQHIDKKILKNVWDHLDQEQIHFKRELSALLPIGQHPILRDFKGMLKKEMGKYF